jgi:hypothetical protein
MIWDSLDEENRVSLAVKAINIGNESRSEMVIINKYSKV